MTINRITIIVPTDQLSSVEECLRSAGVPGMTIDNVRGFGGYKNFFRDDLLSSNSRIEVYVGDDRSDEVVETVKSFALDRHSMAGILVVETVDCLFDLNTGQDVAADTL